MDEEEVGCEDEPESAVVEGKIGDAVADVAALTEEDHATLESVDDEGGCCLRVGESWDAAAANVKGEGALDQTDELAPVTVAAGADVSVLDPESTSSQADARDEADADQEEGKFVGFAREADDDEGDEDEAGVGEACFALSPAATGAEDFASKDHEVPAAGAAAAAAAEEDVATGT